ncbi:hypothetical protein DRN86_03315 [Candidatus Geothermarchaeota archaeon]|nr:MAG: hypothetical protein DRN86_03315 [Candidatus Geothermarchaeota archaeon]
MVRIVVKDITVTYGSIKALKDATLTLDEGEVTGIIGPNGAGKTTLLRTLARLLKPAKGVVYINGRNLWSMKPSEKAKIIAYQGPEPPLWGNAKVLDYMLTARYPHTSRFLETEADIEKIEKALKMVRALHLIDRRLNQLSSGELQRILIARLLAQEAKILLIDEPTSHLDLYYQMEILQMLKSITRNKKLVTIITLHDLQLASMYCDKLILLNKGVIEAAGKPEHVLTPENIAKVYNVRVEVIKHPKKGLLIIPLELE